MPRKPRRKAQSAARHANVFAALGDETRLALVRTLADGRPRSISTLCVDSPLSRQAITKHLRVLCDAGLVRSAKRGRERVLALENARLTDARTALDAIARQWADALARLKVHVERRASE